MLVGSDVILINGLFSLETALYNQLQELERFIGLGQQNATDKMGYTPLHYAARNGHLDACEILLNAGANLNAVTSSGGVTSLMRAAAMGKHSFAAFRNSNQHLITHLPFVSLIPC